VDHQTAHFFFLLVSGGCVLLFIFFCFFALGHARDARARVGLTGSRRYEGDGLKNSIFLVSMLPAYTLNAVAKAIVHIPVREPSLSEWAKYAIKAAMQQLGLVPQEGGNCDVQLTFGPKGGILVFPDGDSCCVVYDGADHPAGSKDLPFSFKITPPESTRIAVVKTKGERVLRVDLSHGTFLVCIINGVAYVQRVSAKDGKSSESKTQNKPQKKFRSYDERQKKFVTKLESYRTSEEAGQYALQYIVTKSVHDIPIHPPTENSEARAAITAVMTEKCYEQAGITDLVIRRAFDGNGGIAVFGRGNVAAIRDGEDEPIEERDWPFLKVSFPFNRNGSPFVRLVSKTEPHVLEVYQNSSHHLVCFMHEIAYVCKVN
jgi:hypothetical protein